MDQYNMEQPLQHPEQTPQGRQQKELSPKQIVSRSFFALFIMAVTVNAVQYVILLLVRRIKPEIADKGWFDWALLLLSMVIIGFPVYYLIIRKVPDSPKRKVERISPLYFISFFFICASGMYIANFLTQIIVILISLSKGGEVRNPAMETIMGGNFILSLIYVSIVAPIFEELVFRKILLNKLRRFGDVPAILMTGLAFGLFHFNLLQFFYAAVLGMLFAYITIRTNTIRYSIMLHMIINFIGTAVTPLVMKQNMVAIMLLFNWMVAAVFLGILFFILNFRKIRLEKADPPMNISSYILNPGTILFAIISVVFITLATLV